MIVQTGAYISAFLLVVAGSLPVCGKAPSVRRRALLGAVAAAVVAVPVAGQPVALWLTGSGTGLSVTTTALLAIFCWYRLTGRSLPDACVRMPVWMIGGAAGCVLYPSALGLNRAGAYALGWGRAWPLAVVWLLVAVLIWRRNPFGLVLVLAVLAFNLRLLESTNLWDYLVDPIYAGVSLLALAAESVRILRIRAAS